MFTRLKELVAYNGLSRIIIVLFIRIPVMLPLVILDVALEFLMDRLDEIIELASDLTPALKEPEEAA